VWLDQRLILRRSSPLRLETNNYKCTYRNVEYYISWWHYLYFCNMLSSRGWKNSFNLHCCDLGCHKLDQLWQLQWCIFIVFGQFSFNFNQPRLNETFSLASSSLKLLLLTWKNHSDNTNCIFIHKFLFCYSPLSLLLWLGKRKVLTFGQKLILYSMCQLSFSFVSYDLQNKNLLFESLNNT